jgi:pimeloyl-ACP methyl ester carboxylesterase
MRKISVALFVGIGALACLAAGADGRTGTHRYYEVQGTKLYTERFGHGPPILFLHGGLTFFDPAFRHQRDYFATYRTVIGLDQRGLGHSADSAEPLSYKQMADDTAAVIELLGLGPVDVVGHSDGGNVGLLLARDHPRLVRRLVISGANLRPGLAPDELQRRSQWSSQQVAEKVRALADSLPPQFRTEYDKVSPDGPAHWLTMVAKHYQLWLQPVVINITDLEKISIPVLVMAGDHDFTSIEETVEIFRGLQQGQLMILPATGHPTFSQRPDLVNLSIREFLDKPVTSKQIP